MAKKIKPVHSGEIPREDFIVPPGLSMNKLALGLHAPVTRIAEIVPGRRAITSDTALRLARYFNTTPQFWMNLQARLDLDIAEDRQAEEIPWHVRPLDTRRQRRCLFPKIAPVSCRCACLGG